MYKISDQIIVFIFIIPITCKILDLMIELTLIILDKLKYAITKFWIKPFYLKIYIFSRLWRESWLMIWTTLMFFPFFKGISKLKLERIEKANWFYGKRVHESMVLEMTFSNSGFSYLFRKISCGISYHFPEIVKTLSENKAK